MGNQKLITEREKGKLIKKYESHLARAPGGIFSKPTRERLLGLARPYGGERDNTIANFRRRVRTYVSNALVDLELFIDTVDKNQIDQVITAEAIEPILKILLRKPVIDASYKKNVFWEFVEQEIKLLGPNTDKSDVDKIIEDKRMQIDLDRPDTNRAEISQLLIKYGFEYLRKMTPIRLLEPSNKLISEAIELSGDLTQYFKPPEERRFYPKVR